MPERVNTATATAAVALSPLARVVRTVIQTVIAVGASIPVLLASTNLTGASITKAEAIVAGAVAVVSTLQNLLEHYGVLPVVGGTPVAQEA